MHTLLASPTPTSPASPTPHTSPPSALQRLRRALRSLSFQRELLIDLMGFGPFAEMAMTRDGFLVARPKRSLGFDALIRQVSPATQARTGRLWLELDPSDRSLVLDRLRAQGISPYRVGIFPEGEVPDGS